MTVRLGFAVPLILALVLPAAAFGAEKPPKTRGARTWTWSFAADTLGQAPPNTASFGGSWEVIVDSSRAVPGGAAPAGAPVAPAGSEAPTDSAAPASSRAPADSAAATTAAATTAAAPSPLPAGPRVLRQSEADDGIRFHYIQFKKPVLEDQAVSVRFRILAGEIDPTAGVMFQVDAKGRNGYIVRVSGESNQLIVHYFIYGKRRDLRFAKIPPVEPGTWHTLSVERKGAIMVVRYDGEERIRMRDERYSGGSVGLWTEDDTVVDFEQLAVSKR